MFMSKSLMAPKVLPHEGGRCVCKSNDGNMWEMPNGGLNLGKLGETDMAFNMDLEVN